MKLFLAMLLIVTAVSCGKNEPLRQLGDGAELFAQESGKFLESVGRIPRIVLNKVLGTDPDTDEELDDLEKEVAKLKKDLLKKYNKVFDLYKELKKKVEDGDESSDDEESDDDDSSS